MIIAVYFDDKNKVTKTMSYAAPRLLAARYGFLGADADRFEGLVRAIGEDAVAFLLREVKPATDFDAVKRLVPEKQRFIAAYISDLPAGSHDDEGGWLVKDGKVVKGKAAKA